MDINKKLKITFFGTSEFAVNILNELKTSGACLSGRQGLTSPLISLNLIVTAPDKPAGRKLVITSPPIKIWADKNNIPTLQPEKLDEKFINKLKSQDWDLFIVSAYGKIIPQSILNLPKYGTLNVHPSLLPKYRGATPIHSAILAGERETGVSIILLDEKMDHGLIVAQEKITLWKNSLDEMPTESQLEKTLAQVSEKLLGSLASKWIKGEIKAVEQDHNQATFCKKLKSDDALIDLDGNAKENFLKIQAFDKWPKAHFFQNEKRMIIKKARLENDELIIDRVVPEGGQETDYSNLLK